MLTTHLGYGDFHLSDFRPGERFARYDGTLCEVIGVQGDRVHIWSQVDSPMHAEKITLHETARVFAVDAKQAKKIEKRANATR